MTKSAIPDKVAAPVKILSGYLLAIVLTGVAAGVGYALRDQADGKGTMMLFTPAVLIAAWYGGVGPGLFAIALGGLLTTWLIIPPVNSINLGDNADRIGLALYLITSFGILALVRKERIEKRNREIAQADLRVANQSLEQRVQERTSELEIANQELERFCYSVSHDLRAPARAIVGNSHILLEDFQGEVSKPVREKLIRISSAAVKLSDLVDALLVYARLAKAGLRYEPVDICGMIDEEVAALRKVGQAPIAIEKPASLVIQGDRRLLRTAVGALISNAVKYAKRGEAATLRVSSEQIGNDVVVSFRDNGVGFDPTYIHKVFEPFERLHRDEDYPGVGMGLANVARIVGRHKGSVWAESTLGQGTAVFLRFGDQPAGLPAVKGTGSLAPLANR